MKKSILAILAVVTLAACEKKETVVVDNGTDSTVVVQDSTMPEVSTDGSGEMVGTMTAQDKTFADAAAKGGMMEVMLGEMAQANGANAMVKDFGKMIVTDHTKANDELKAWATSAGYTLPTSMDADQQKMVDDLKMKMGADFDKAYTEMMVEDHKKDIDAFKKESMEGTGDLKAFALKTVPVLEGHLVKAEAAMNAVK